MKLIISATPTTPAHLTVVNGSEIIVEYEVYGQNLEEAIDTVFQERYIEAVQFIEHGSYIERFASYIANKYQGVEIL